ncbi:class IIb bacteriocin, lactobin A/cerein 7B family [Aliiglaciecola sp. 3_MG-2023]|uniref:class IIb bacteriocin, lactobin A/cerein 7B family n=1 Tax=Aliiglaciecola sp. 3_MG-2023 TaxID=3062644 RepID=UPI0026E26D73|nr:class IIb bacteriocin, lactobin A/cerein 7B family [Aliiglaciecola sp. 3_MG-2023]MDO6692129.1 class IIb bacteriocin, lactobin A/cerein 7B family [Aliiglaciecola sp. 3_MG-2023]
MRELNEMQLEEVNGGVAPLIVAFGAGMSAVGYINSLPGLMSFGRGLGFGWYDATH